MCVSQVDYQLVKRTTKYKKKEQAQPVLETQQQVENM